MLANLDEESSLPTLSGAHRKPKAEKDMRVVVDELLKSSFPTLAQPRKYSTFPNPRDPLHAKSVTDVKNWIINHVVKRKNTVQTQ